jgi:MFS transporter, ACS family, tartrate transporter
MNATAVEKKRLYNKIRWAIMPFACLLFFFNGTDRANVSFAALTMNHDLGISALAFGTITSAFFISYLIFQIPSNMILKKVGASKIIPIIACAWGLITACTFFAKTGPQVAMIRFLLGVAEAGFFPGMMYWFTLYFPSRERAIVTSIFFAVATVGGLVMSPVAGYIIQYTHWAGHAGWRWLFVIEGVIPAIFALFGFIIMKDSPNECKWLTDREKEIVNADLEDERALQASQTSTTKVGFVKIITNGMLWKIAMIYMFAQIAAQTSGMWMPVLLKGFASGLSPTAIGYIMMIPTICSFFALLIVGKHSDKTGERKWHAILPLLLFSVSFMLILLPVGGITFKCIMLALTGIGGASWTGPYWTMPAAFLAPGTMAVSMAFINSCSAAGGYIGNMFSGIVAQSMGNTGVFIFMATVILVSVVLIMTLDFKKMKKFEQHIKD